MNFRKAFIRSEVLGPIYKNYLELKDTKINSKGIAPHEIVKLCRHRDISDSEKMMLNKQWQDIVDEVSKSNIFDNSIAISDVSGSMEGTPICVSIALGILIAQCSKGPFKNKLITFSSEPEIFSLNDNHGIHKKVDSVSKMKWGMNTDMDAVFKLLLNHSKLSGTQVPDKLFIFTDMQFDNFQKNYFPEVVDNMYGNSNMNRPKIIVWNLRSESIPISFDTRGLILLSGFSKEILKYVTSDLSNKTPLDFIKDSLKHIKEFSEDV
jgi:hypothetical protein